MLYMYIHVHMYVSCIICMWMYIHVHVYDVCIIYSMIHILYSPKLSRARTFADVAASVKVLCVVGPTPYSSIGNP